MLDRRDAGGGAVLSWLADAHGTVTWCSPSLADFSSISLAQLRDDGWVRLLEPSTRMTATMRWDAARATARGCELTCALIDARGIAHRAQTNIEPVSHDSVVTGWVGTHVIRRRRTDDATPDAPDIEDALPESAEQFRDTFENAAVGIAHLDIDGHWLNVNDRLCAITGYTRAELLDRTFQEMTHPDDLDLDVRLMRDVLAGRLSTYSIEKRYLRRQGGATWINLTVSLSRRRTGEPHHFISIVEDIGDRKRAESLLRVQKEVLEMIIADAPLADVLSALMRALEDEDPLVSCTIVLPESSTHPAHGVGASQVARVRYLDEVCLQRPCGSPAAEVLRTAAGITVDHVQDESRWPAPWRDDVLRQGMNSCRVTPVRATDGSTLAAIDVCARDHKFVAAFDPALLELATQLASIAIERRRADERQRVATERALRASEALRADDVRKDQFLATLAHELRNPLAPIVNGLQML
ncbi:MAG TPA: PAS domain S-box protein, partial [Gemmatimonadaceae bacterium]|nr:PAS domain S-box protein [Gemmatimonadaceae bacterium]